MHTVALPTSTIKHQPLKQSSFAGWLRSRYESDFHKRLVYIFVKMLAVYTVLLLALIGSGILPLSVHAKSSKSSGSGDNNQNGYCKNSAISDKAVEEKIKFLDGCRAILPSCALLAPGAISKIDFYNGNSKKTTTVLTCYGCVSPQVPITCSSDCKNVLDIFRHDLDNFCEVAFPQCRNIAIYRCGSPAVSTTTVRATSPIATTASTKAPITTVLTTTTFTAAPTTTVLTTTTSTAAPTTTVLTTTTSPAAPTTTVLTTTTSTAAPTTSTAAPTTSTAAPTTSTAAPTTTQPATTASPDTPTPPPTNPIAQQTTFIVPPSTTTLATSTRDFTPFHELTDPYYTHGPDPE